VEDKEGVHEFGGVISIEAALKVYHQNKGLRTGERPAKGDSVKKSKKERTSELGRWE